MSLTLYMNLNISPKVRQKLAAKHNVEIHEVEQCFCNREKGFLKDTREDHKTDPPTLWFIAETNFGRKLKIIFIILEDKSVSIKSAFPPNDIELKIYSRHA